MSLRDSYLRLMKHKSQRMWIQQNPKIHLLNYWFYRYFTKSYYNFLLYHLNLKDSHILACAMCGGKK